ncbi:RICIN domain-containing protein [Luteibacter sp. 9135]|uniref:RICIN domain-containing protein n=1 Tax=Luteibacter sp. 9135 TaxID=1500893 RepID=UPI00056B1414|nr:RICIN domain-containing protein [Luteibacter sp. 9135]
MRHPLSLCLSLALMGTVGHAVASPASTSAPPVYLRLSELGTALAADGQRTSASHFSFPHLAGAETKARLLWLTSTELASREVRELVAEALLLGDGILVSRNGTGDTERAMFGFAGQSGMSVYRRSPDGVLDVMVIDDAMSVEDATARVTDWFARSSPKAGRPTPVRLARQVDGVNAADKLDDGSYTPSLQLRVDKPFADGRRIFHDIKIMRDVTPSRDDKVVIVKTQVNQAPSRRGTWWNGAPNPGGKAYYLLVPDRYRVTTGLNFADDASLVTLQEYAPVSDGVKERTVNHSLSIKASSNLSATPDVLAALASVGAPSAGKLPVMLSSGRERMETQSVTMTLKDYTTHVTPVTIGQSRGVSWAFPLANDIASDIDYFKDGENHNASLLSERKATPMMKSATLEMASTWRIQGDRDGDLVVTTRADVATRVYDTLENDSTVEDDEESVMEFTTRVSMDSPFLARQPVVRLQSLAGTGACLTQPDTGRPDVVMAACDRGEANPGQQWMLELDGTYRNRASKRCLTAEETSGEVVVSDCDSPSLNKQWSWSADRIHSRYAGGNHWRLHVRGGRPNAKFDPALHQVIVSNDSHPLLRPWSSYPNKPTPGDVIPRLATVSPPVPESYLAYREVSADERWQPVLVRK